MLGQGEAFQSVCPNRECGDNVLQKPPPSTVAPSRADEIRGLESELEVLRAVEQTADVARSIAHVQQRLIRLRRPKRAAEKPVATLPTQLAAPAETVLPGTVVYTPPLPAIPTAPTALPDCDIVDFMRTRLATIEAQKQKLDQEARKIRAMLAVADATP